MKIRITYKVKNESEKHLNFTPEEYFDPLDDDETFDKNGIPKFDHAEEYLEIPIEKLEWTEIEVNKKNNGRCIRTQYFDEGKSQMIHVKDLADYEEIIVSS